MPPPKKTAKLNTYGKLVGHLLLQEPRELFQITDYPFVFKKFLPLITT